MKKKPKHVAVMIFNYLLMIFYTIKCVLDCKIIYILRITENTTGVLHLKNKGDVS